MRIRSLGAFLGVGLVVAACESAAPPPANAPAVPVASSAAPVVAATSCLMTHICGCNLGCAKIAVDAASLHEGTRTTAQTGPYAGKEMMVVKEQDATGGSVFALSDREHTMACERETPQSKALMGFACASKDSGPVPAHACAKGCD